MAATSRCLSVAGGRTHALLGAVGADHPTIAQSRPSRGLCRLLHRAETRLLAAGDLFVSASAEESFGIAFVEAWAAGLPVIGANQGAIPSVIDAGEDGLLFDYPDADESGARDADLAGRPVPPPDDGRGRAAKGTGRYTWDAITAQVRAVYTEVIAERRTGEK